MEQTTQKVALYCRIANHVQPSDNVAEVQRTTLWSFATKQGFTGIMEYLDYGYSGNDFERPAFKQMDTDIKAGIISTVIVRSADRIARNSLIANEWINGLSAFGVRFIATDGSHEFPLSMNDIFELIKKRKRVKMCTHKMQLHPAD